ncbi:MAG TPA: serine hydrolase [Segetibacter sp.]|jgi:beta-lactamase class A
MKAFITILLLLTMMSTTAQRTDKKLLRKVETLLQGFNGQAGVYLHDLKKNKSITINADTIFATASMVKIPILIGVMDKIEKGELSYDQQLVYKDSLLYAGEDILGSFKKDEKISLSKVLMLMLTTSDNTASLWLQSLAGTGTRINQLLDSMGFKYTRVNSRTPGREANRTQYGWGQTTPAEMALMMEKIVRKEVVNKKASERMLRLLGRNFWDENAISQLPPDVFIASKNGAVNAARSEVLYVNSPGSRYIFCICTQNNKDQSWTPGNEAWTLTRKLSLLLWKHFNPRSNWQPLVN